MKHLSNILEGAISVFESFSSSRQYVTNTRGFERDSRALAQDARNVAADFKKQSELIYGSSSAGASQER